MSVPHPARTMPFRDLVDGLRSARDARLVTEQRSATGLSLYCYTQSCVYDAQWNEVTRIARGLILDVQREAVIATPFPKFFNAFERGESVPDLPFETFEKVDGSLIIIFWHDDAWRTATKGAFASVQAQWAAARLKTCDLSGLRRGTTYLAEAVYADNRIVVRYAEEALVLLAAYDHSGQELSYDALRTTGEGLGWRVATRHSYGSVAELLATAKDLSREAEGFVVRFSDGLRLKIKGDEYRRIHALISRVTPLGMWEVMLAGDDLEKLRRDIPEEFWVDFDAIVAVLQQRLDTMLALAVREAQAVAHLTDKEVGLRLHQFPAEVRPFVFAFRKQGGDLMVGRARQLLFRSIRPTANELPGYVPSYAMHRALDEAM
jgi:RNA ligase